MSTVQTIVESAYRKCGIRDTTNTTLMADGLSAFNMMIKTLSEEFHFAKYNESFTLTALTGTYTIGVGGTLNTVRPSKIVSAYIRDSEGSDYSVNVEMTQQDYDLITDKDTIARPTDLYYNPSNPLGYIYFNSVPETAETLYLSSHKPFTVYTALSDTILEPVEYEKMYIFNLAVDLAPEQSVQLQQTVIEQSVIEKRNISTRNSSPAPLAKLDNGLLRM